jgi:hypothetical protein
LPPHALTPPHNDHSVFRLSPTAIAMRIIFTASLTSCLGISYRWEGPVKIKEFQTD